MCIKRYVYYRIIDVGLRVRLQLDNTHIGGHRGRRQTYLVVMKFHAYSL